MTGCAAVSLLVLAQGQTGAEVRRVSLVYVVQTDYSCKRSEFHLCLSCLEIAIDPAGLDVALPRENSVECVQISVNVRS